MTKKVILVTGGNRGIGKEICRQLGSLGHRVYLGTRDPEKGQQAVSDMEGDIVAVKLSVTSKEDLLEVKKKIETESGHLDVLINNAGVISSGQGVIDQDMNEAHEVFDTNFFGPWLTSQIMKPLLIKSKDGRITNMSSGMGAWNDLVTGYAAYRLSKTSLNALTVFMSNELSPDIKVNAMCPGWVRTDMGGSAASRPVEKGAETAVWLAVNDQIPNGKFLRDKEIISW